MGEKETAIVILAAGKGTRMQSKLPKILHKVGGKSMISHVIDTAHTLKPQPSKIITVFGRDMEDVKEAISEYSQTVVQEHQHGTADAVKAALPNLKGFKGNVIILYADTPLVTASSMQKMLDALTSDVAVCTLGFSPDDAAEYGRMIVDDTKMLKHIVEFKDADDTQKQIKLCNSGVMAVKGGVLQGLLDKVSNRNAKKEFYLTDIIEIAWEMGHQCTYIEGNPLEVVGANNRLQLSEVEKIFQQRLRKAVMERGVTLIDPDTIYLSHDMKVGRDITIHPNVVFGSGVVIEDNVEIFPFSHIEGANIGEGSKIGPFARLRPGTKLEENVKVGNFVEVKKSLLEDGVKVGHLSYIGDTTIGTQTNIGAGTITCNYDGYQKYHTDIGSHVFIGSHTSLVAPVKVGDGALVAAGSTITRDVEADDLAVARAKQYNKQKGSEKFRQRNNPADKKEVS